MVISPTKLLIGYFISLLLVFGLGFRIGKSETELKQEVNIKQSIETKKNNEKVIDTIRNEPDSAVVKRFRENYGTVR